MRFVRCGSYHHRGARTRPQYICLAINGDSGPGAGYTAARARLLPAGYRGREGLAVGVTPALVGDGTGTGALVLVGDGTAAVALGATGAGALHRDLPVGLGTGVALAPVGAGTGVAVQGAEVGTATGVPPAGLAVGVPGPFPRATAVGVAVGATGPGAAVFGPADVMLGPGLPGTSVLATGLLGTGLAELAAADAA